MQIKSILFLLLAIPLTAVAQFKAEMPVVCFDFDSLQNAIKESKYKEEITWAGAGADDSFYVMYENKETGTWTMIRSNGVHSCIIGAGERALDVKK